ncbi:MAG: hypothetical protein Q9213_004994 [Squamulea squamosa]
MATSPLYMASRHDLEDAFNAMHPCFEDKESEDNFKLRDQAISKLRRLTAGNSPTELSDAYVIGIKALLEGIIKVINSLRTTVSKNGCDLIQEMAKAKIPSMDNIAEIVFPHLLKLCASTKKIGADKANDTITIIISNVSYNIYLMKLIWSACDDKNVQPRKFATGWLKTLVGRHRENKHVFEKGDGLTLFEKCLKKGLADSNPDVRQFMRPTYWAFIRLWPERSAGILSTLSDQHRKVLISESTETATVPAPAKAATAAAAKSAAPKPKQSIKDTIAAKRQAAKTEKTPAPEAKIARSSSLTKSDKMSAPEAKIAMSSTSTKRDKTPAPEAKSDKPAVPQSKVSTTVPSNPRPASVAAMTRTLSSAPVRPSRLTRKPTTTAKMESSDFSKSAIEVSKSTTEVPKSTIEVPKSPIRVPNSSIEVPKSPIEVPTTTIEVPKSPIKVPKAASPQMPASPIFKMLRERSQSPVLISRPLSPTTTTLGLSPTREFASPPLITMLRERSLSPASSAKSTSKASETLTATSFDRPMKAVCSRKEGLARKALEELSVNDPIKRTAKPTHGEVLSQEKWMKVERHQMALSSPKEEPHMRPATVESLRGKMLVRINDIKCNTYRLSTLREIQCIVRGNWPVLGDDPQLFDELLFALFDLIESWSYVDRCTVRACGSDHNTQVLLTLRIMLRYHNNLFSTYYPRAFCALLSASRSQEDSTHMRFGLEDTIKAIANECDVGNLEDSIDSILDYIESYTDYNHKQPEHLGLLALMELMKLSDPERLCRPYDQADRLGKLAARVLRSGYPELRQRAVDYSLLYASFLADDERFWKLTADIGNDRARLLTYYFTKERVAEAFRVEGELIDRAFQA